MEQGQMNGYSQDGPGIPLTVTCSVGRNVMQQHELSSNETHELAQSQAVSLPNPSDIPVPNHALSKQYTDSESVLPLPAQTRISPRQVGLRMESPARREQRSQPKKGSFACQAESTCTSTFTRDKDRIKHENSVHRKGRAFICGTQGCKYSNPSQAFYRKDHLTQHIRRTGHMRGQSFAPKDATAPVETELVNARGEDASDVLSLERSGTDSRKRAREDFESGTAAGTVIEERMSLEEMKALLERQEKRLKLEMEEREEEWKPRVTKMEFKYKKLEMEMEDYAVENAKLKRLVKELEAEEGRKRSRWQYI